MKKIVVVVDGSPIRFNEEQTSAYYDETANYLMINDTSQEQPRKIAGFTKWDYWYYEDQEKTDFGTVKLWESPTKIDVLEKWFFDDLMYSPRLQEPRRLAQEHFILEKLGDSLNEARKTLCHDAESRDKNKDILNTLDAEHEATHKEQEKIEKDIIKYFKKELPERLMYRYLRFFPESRWYEK